MNLIMRKVPSDGKGETLGKEPSRRPLSTNENKTTVSGLRKGGRENIPQPWKKPGYGTWQWQEPSF